MLEALVGMFSYPFIVRALIGGAVISLCASLLGVSLVLKRYSMIGDGLSHVGFGAVAVASALGLSPMGVAIPVVIIAAFLLLRLNESGKIKGDAAVAMVSSGALAAGVIAVSVTTGINTDFYSYMFGSILGMSKGDVVLSLCVCIPVLILFAIFYNRIFSVTFDESFARAAGVKAGLYNAIVAVLTALTVVLGMRLMGALLISSLVIFPCLTAMRVCRSFKAVTICAAIVSLSCFFMGMYLSVLFSLPTGASIVGMNVLCFAVFSLVGRIKKKN